MLKGRGGEKLEKNVRTHTQINTNTHYKLHHLGVGLISGLVLNLHYYGHSLHQMCKSVHKGVKARER